jgi:hypothetical protein
MSNRYPIIYVRGYAGTQGDVEETVDDPFYGFNLGSTHIRMDEQGLAEFYAFESPFVRLMTEHGYNDVFNGVVQVISPDFANPLQTIWIYRYYDPTSKTYDRPGGRRLSIEEAADGLRVFIQQVKDQTKAPKVYLIAHSMGGLVCRSLLQKIYLEKGDDARNHVDKLFTYGTPHGGIHFIGGGLLEKVRDALGVNDSNVFGPDRMYQYLTPGVKAGASAPKDFIPDVVPDTAFDVERIFCIVGTNARDYDVGGGLSRTAVGPQSDGLVQIESASVHAAPRAYIYRSHSGRYGMVNSEEGYQNLRRFLFGDVRVEMVLSDFDLDFSANSDSVQVTYQIEIQVAIRNSLILMHERSRMHYCPIGLNQEQWVAQRPKGLPVYTTFLLGKLAKDGTLRYMVRIAVYSQKFEHGFLSLRDHIERLPVWSDYLIVELRVSEGQFPWNPFYSWASINREPGNALEIVNVSTDEYDAIAPLPPQGQAALGSEANVRFRTFPWA